MKEVPFRNDQKETVYVGGKMIPPGETRFILASYHPGYKGDDNAKAEHAAEVPELLKHLDKSVKDIIALLPEFTTAEINQLKEAEDKGSTRSSMMKAFDEFLLERASDINSALSLDAEGIIELLSETDEVTEAFVHEIIAAEEADKKREDVIQALKNYLVTEEENRNKEADAWLEQPLDEMAAEIKNVSAEGLGFILDREKATQARPDVIELIESELTEVL